MKDYIYISLSFTIGFLLLYVMNKIFKESELEIANKKAISDLKISPNLMTITEQEALNIANNVHNALEGAGTGTHEILNAFKIPFTDWVMYYTWDVTKSPLNRYDLIAIKKLFGVRSGETIGQWLANEVDPVPYSAVNELYNYKNTNL